MAVAYAVNARLSAACWVAPSANALRSHIVDVVLQGEALNPLCGKLACSQIREIATFHQPFGAWLDDFPDHGIDELPVFHFRSQGNSPRDLFSAPSVDPLRQIGRIFRP
jgi:hypothetical protein